jgi:hypothetical protein
MHHIEFICPIFSFGKNVPLLSGPLNLSKKNKSNISEIMGLMQERTWGPGRPISFYEYGAEEKS